MENAVETNLPNESTDTSENADPNLVEDVTEFDFEEDDTKIYFEEYARIERAKDGYIEGSVSVMYGCAPYASLGLREDVEKPALNRS